MCEECEEFPAQYVAYFNKAGGKLWRPAQKAALTPWAIDIRPVEPPPCAPPLAGEGRGGVRHAGSAGVPPALKNDSASLMRGSSDRAGETPALLRGVPPPAWQEPSDVEVELSKSTGEPPTLPASRFRCEETRS